MYIFFTGADGGAGRSSIASIGTQISEAFAGLDRIREIRRDGDRGSGGRRRARRSPTSDGEVAFEDVSVRVQPRRAGAEARHRSARRPASTTALVGSSGSGKSTLISLVMAFNRPQSGPRARRRPRPRRRSSCATTARTSASCCRTTSCSTARSPRTSRYARPHATREEIKRGQPHRALRRVHRGVREGLRHDRRRARRAALGRPAAARRDRARDSRRPARS